MTSPQDFINSLQIASPCPAAWADMAGDDRARFCAQCEKHVYDFSKMTAAEGLSLIQEKEGQVCARLWRRADGTVITADCPVGMKQLLNRRTGRLPILAASLIGTALLNLGCLPKSPEPEPSKSPVAQQALPCKPSENPKDKIRFVTVGFAAAPFSPNMDMNSTSTGINLDSETLSHLPLK